MSNGYTRLKCTISFHVVNHSIDRALSLENCFAVREGADQSEHPRSLINACVIRFLKYIVAKFVYPQNLKSAGYYVIPSIQKIAFECPSVCLSVCTSVRPSAHRFHSLLGAFLTNFLQHCYES